MAQSGTRALSERKNVAYRLARQMLDCLLRATAEKFRLGDLDDLDFAPPPANKVVPKLPADKAAYAIRLAYCLAPHFPTLKELVATKAFVTITSAEGDEGAVIGKVLAEIAAKDAGGMALNPTYPLNRHNRFIVLADGTVFFTPDDLRAIAAAGMLGYPVFCVIPSATELPESLTGVDLTLNLPGLTPEMLELLFEVCHDQMPAGVLQFTGATKLKTVDLIAHMRRARPAAVCLDGLQQLARARTTLPALDVIELKDLEGYGEAKVWGLELAEDLKLWRAGHLSWQEVDHRSVILAGPPGTGKTSFAGILAASLQVSLVTTSVAEWNSSDHLSGTLKRMQAVFAEAKAKAPCVLFIDELDGISSRSSISGRYSEYWTQIVNRMLELVTDALRVEGLIIVGATNHVDRIDPALRRSGRLDQVIFIELPDAAAIARILQRYAGPVFPFSQLEALAPRLLGSSGADIERLVRTAKATARRAGRMFSISDLNSEVPDTLEGVLPSTRRRIAIYRNGQRLVAQILGLADMMVEGQNLDLRQLLAKGLSNERFPTEQVCSDVLAVALAGRAAEEIVFGDVSVFGAGTPQSDLAAATAIAMEMETRAGFGEMGLIYLDDITLSSTLSASVVGGVRRRLESALSRATALLLENLEELEAHKRASANTQLRLLN
ncbi:AAA family ATPase [Devosia sp. PTR5]|uniref:AAA family ATPase n=1 Tax=Devosia oryzisoli TaxID=2774138 RepID=A0A927IUL8_9HYPH|nr:AAA family ATPase [Devosia oryzisoli]MBD8066993.1 AAA family ATPase [Devosia oryzisoli]